MVFTALIGIEAAGGRRKGRNAAHTAGPLTQAGLDRPHTRVVSTDAFSVKRDAGLCVVAARHAAEAVRAATQAGEGGGARQTLVGTHAEIGAAGLAL